MTTTARIKVDEYKKDPRKCIEQIESCEYDNEDGMLKNNVAWQAIKELLNSYYQGGGTYKIDVQIINNGAVHEAEREFPNLFKEVWNQDMYSNSSWYELSERAYIEWLEFTRQRRRRNIQ